MTSNIQHIRSKMTDIVKSIDLHKNLRPGKPPNEINNVLLKDAIEICIKREASKIQKRKRIMERIKNYPVR